MKERVLVTGAGGFIGSHLVEALLEKGYRVRAMVHYNAQNNWGWIEDILANHKFFDPQKTNMGIMYKMSGDASIEIVSGDVRDPFFTDAAVNGCRTVFHLAALIAIPYSYMAPATYVSTNVMGTLNILEACRKHNVEKAVHTSTSEVYGTAQYTPIDEKHPLVGQSPYSASKIGADHLAESYYRSFDLPVSVIRPFNTFGPRQSARAVIPTVISQVLSGADVIRLGDLEPVRDLNFVKDTVKGFMAVMDSDETIGKVTNIGRGEGITIGDLAKMILEICNSSAIIETDPDRVRPGKSEVFKLICDRGRANELLGWKPVYALRQGLKETVDWISENLSRYKSDIYNV